MNSFYCKKKLFIVLIQNITLTLMFPKQRNKIRLNFRKT